MPWEEIAENLDCYIDTEKYQLPVPFRPPDELSSFNALALAHYFKEVSTLSPDDPFVFLPGVTEEEAMLEGGGGFEGGGGNGRTEDEGSPGGEEFEGDGASDSKKSEKSVEKNRSLGSLSIGSAGGEFPNLTCS